VLAVLHLVHSLITASTEPYGMTTALFAPMQAACCSRLVPELKYCLSRTLQAMPAASVPRVSADKQADPSVDIISDLYQRGMPFKLGGLWGPPLCCIRL
jgi:hypothetical protein